MELSVGSLFCGIGGIDLAFQQAGFHIAWATEIDDACCKTYRYNFRNNHLIKKDIRHLDPSSLPFVDVITAGFPCQPFSIAGKQHGFSDPRGNLFYEATKFISILKPRYVFLENVANLISHDNGKTFLSIHNILFAEGYSLRYRVMRASEYSTLPQIRDRIYIIAFRNQIDCDCFVFPNKLSGHCSIEDILNRKNRQNDIYYYPENDPFFKKASAIVTKHNSIYRVYHDSIKETQHHMCPTLTASMGIYNNQIPLILDDYGLRRLTLRECLDFQGFPKDYYFPNTITLYDAYKQIGNSVCVPVIKRIAEQIMKQAN